ncbi:MAG: hypothetical protein ACYDG2_17190, partial [Ruminiclostridium sp.]
EAVIEIVDLLQSLYIFFQETDPKHAKRSMTSFCERCGLQMLNGLPRTSLQCKKDRNGDSAASTIIYSYSTDRQIPKKEVTLINTIREVEIHFSSDNVEENLRASSISKPKFIIEKQVSERTFVRNYDWDNLNDNCQLYREFCSGSRIFNHDERFGIALNLMMIQGGRTKLANGIAIKEEYDDKRWKLICNYILESDYKPEKCENYCPYRDKCNHAETMLKQGKLSKGDVRIIGRPKLKTLQEAEKGLSEAINYALTAGDDKVYVIKAPTGIGKSQNYLNVKNALIAVPTHKLKEEIYNRMLEAGNDVLRTPELSQLESYQRNKLNSLYSMGAFHLAAMYIKYLSHEEGIIGATQYLKEIEVAKASDKTVITTHERLLYFGGCQNTIIIDEDILQTLLKQGRASLNELEYLTYLTLKEPIHTVIDGILNFVKSTPNSIITPMPAVVRQSTEKLEQIVVNSKKVSSNILGFLKCTYFVKINDNIYYIIQRELPKKKTIILSATADEKMYQSIFGDRLVFIDIGLVETKGKLMQYPGRSFSRFQFKENKDDLMQIVESIVGSIPKISYKALESDFGEEYACNFGACEGIDKYCDMDIAVVGTPHVNPVVYGLYAAALGRMTTIFDYKKATYAQVERNGYRFKFMTYSEDPVLQDVQLYFIESELIQAVGRARILRNDCTVTVFSNYPLPGAEFKYYESKNN